MILVGHDIRLQLRPFDLAVLGNQAFTLFTRQARKGNCACCRLPIATGWILSTLFYPLFLLRLSDLAMSTCRPPQPKPSASCATLLLRYPLRLCQQTRNYVLRFVLSISLASCSRVAHAYPIQRLLVEFQLMLSFFSVAAIHAHFYRNASTLRLRRLRRMSRSTLQTSMTRVTITAADQTMFAMLTRPACLSLRRRKRLSSGSMSRGKCFATLKRLEDSTMFLSNS